MHEGAVRNCAIKALVKYEKRCPDCFNPFAATNYAPDLSTEEMDKEQIWWLMTSTKEQRLALLLDEARALQARKAVNLKQKASGDWYVPILHIDDTTGIERDKRTYALLQQKKKSYR